MKKNILCIFLVYYLFPSFVIGQPKIVRLKVLPENILNNDVVKIVAETLFDPGAGWFDSSTYRLNGNEIIITGHYSRNGASSPNVSIDTIKIGKLLSGDYTLIYKAVVPINQITDIDSIKLNVGVNNIANQNILKLKIYPNPSKGLFTLSLPDTDKYTIEVFNYVGLSVDKIDLQGLFEYALNLKLEKGLYYLKVRNMNGISYNECMMIE